MNTFHFVFQNSLSSLISIACLLLSGLILSSILLALLLRFFSSLFRRRQQYNIRILLLCVLIHTSLNLYFGNTSSTGCEDGKGQSVKRHHIASCRYFIELSVDETAQRFIVRI